MEVLTYTKIRICHDDVIKRKHFSVLPSLCAKNSPVSVGFALLNNFRYRVFGRVHELYIAGRGVYIRFVTVTHDVFNIKCDIEMSNNPNVDV